MRIVVVSAGAIGGYFGGRLPAVRLGAHAMPRGQVHPQTA